MINFETSEQNTNENKELFYIEASQPKVRKSGIVLPRSSSKIQLTEIKISTPGENTQELEKEKKSSIVLSQLPTIQSGVTLSCQTLSPHSQQETQSTERRILETVTNLQVRLRKISRDAKPHINNYRSSIHPSSSRPTLDELRDSTPDYQPMTFDDKNPQESKGDKFGWIEGVLVRNMLSIWGVMLFLRISWVVAVAGIWQTLIIIAVSTFITMVTALSMSAVCTNGEIGGGGTYYVMSRILGPEFGGSIGIIFALANAINASLNVVGFCETVQDAMKNYGGYIIVDGAENDIRIMGTILMIFVWGLCGLGAKYEAKTQVILLLILLVALVNFVVGSILGPGDSEEERAKGFLGYDSELFAENFQPGYTVIHGQMESFFSVFSVYFPAAIGIFAGANVSGDLKDPNSAIPKGTILAIIITTISYAVVAIICAGTTERSATGCPPLTNETYNNSCSPKEETYGSYYDTQIMTLVSAFGPLNYAGCFAATLSSALASYISCPKLLQVIGDDKLYPYWLVGFMAKGYGKANEPRLAYLFTFLLALAFVLVADLDMVALLISCFFLATFALMNYSTFHVSLVKPIGWRPTFKYYNMWLSLVTAFLCIVAMFLISWPVALITAVIVFALYLAVLYRSPDVNWGSSTQALTYREALSSMQRLTYVEEHVKNYRPQILVLTGPPSHRPALLDFAYMICRNNSMLVCGNIVKESKTYKARNEMQQNAYRYLRQRKIKGFCSLIDNSDLRSGTSAMLSVAGAGKMKPNILLMGYKHDWRTCETSDLDQYFSVIHVGFDMNAGVAILRVPDGFDYSGILEGSNSELTCISSDDQSTPKLQQSFSVASMLSEYSDGLATPGYAASKFDFTESEQQLSSQQPQNLVQVSSKSNKQTKSSQNTIIKDSNGNPIPKSLANKILMFQKKQKETIDVWWLYDDGGLTLLLPYIISTRSNWASCQLRVLCTTSSHEALEKEHEGMAALLEKFRIRYSDLIVINDLSNKPPSNYTLTWFDDLVRHLIRRENAYGESNIETELKNLKEKTLRFLRLRELLIDHSSDSSLVVMTLPMPRKGAVSAPVYMAWLEAMTANMPPFLLVRGNQSSVLTFYS